MSESRRPHRPAPARTEPCPDLRVRGHRRRPAARDRRSGPRAHVARCRADARPSQVVAAAWLDRRRPARRSGRAARQPELDRHRQLRASTRAALRPGGAADIASPAQRTAAPLPQSLRRFAARLVLVTSPGQAAGLRRESGPEAVVTDLCASDFAADGDMRLAATYEGVLAEGVQVRCGRPPGRLTPRSSRARARPSSPPCAASGSGAKPRPRTLRTARPPLGRQNGMDLRKHAAVIPPGRIEKV